MYVATVPNRSSLPAILLRESFREHGKVRNRTLANLSHWPPEKVEALRQVLRGNWTTELPLRQAFEITRSLPHGHVAAVYGTLRRVGLDVLLGKKASRARQCVLAMIVSRVLEPGSKLATARALGAETRHSTLGELLGLEGVDEDDLYAAMDWLLPRQAAIESASARRHLGEGTLVLYDVTSTYFEGRTCPLARFGHSRDERKSNLQIIFGVLSNGEGCPVAVEVFPGNTGDPKALAQQLSKLRERFGLKRLVLVGDRGMLTEKRIEEELRPLEGLEWITALRTQQVQALVADGSLQLSLFDQRDLAEIQHPDYPGERLILCRNPLLAEERARKRKELLEAAEKKLNEIVAACQRKRRPLKSPERISFLVGKALGPLKVAKYFRWEVTAEGLRYERDPRRIELDAQVDGVYVLRTSLASEQSSPEQTVLAYKRLAVVERAFRSLKSVDLNIRPIHHRLADRVRAHVLICLLAYYVEWHMRRALAPVLFDDQHPGQRTGGSPVAPAQRSLSARRKAQSKRNSEGLPVESFQDWVKDLATITQNHVQPRTKTLPPFQVITRPTAAQQRALELLGVSLSTARL
jgi:transposase